MRASAIDRLAAARSALAAAERATGLVRAPFSLRPSPGAARPAGGLEVVGSAVVEAPAARSRLVRAVLGSCPDGGWAAFVGVADIGWEWARQEGLDLDRVLVVAVPGHVSTGVLAVPGRRRRPVRGPGRAQPGGAAPPRRPRPRAGAPHHHRVPLAGRLPPPRHGPAGGGMR